MLVSLQKKKELACVRGLAPRKSPGVRQTNKTKKKEKNKVKKLHSFGTLKEKKESR